MFQGLMSTREVVLLGTAFLAALAAVVLTLLRSLAWWVQWDTTDGSEAAGRSRAPAVRQPMTAGDASPPRPSATNELENTATEAHLLPVR